MGTNKGGGKSNLCTRAEGASNTKSRIIRSRPPWGEAGRKRQIRNQDPESDLPRERWGVWISWESGPEIKAFPGGGGGGLNLGSLDPRVRPSKAGASDAGVDTVRASPGRGRSARCGSQDPEIRAFPGRSGRKMRPGLSSVGSPWCEASLRKTLSSLTSA